MKHNCHLPAQLPNQGLSGLPRTPTLCEAVESHPNVEKHDVRMGYQLLYLQLFVAIPVPVRGTCTGLPGALVTMFSVAVSVAGSEGLNFTAMVQL